MVRWWKRLKDRQLLKKINRIIEPHGCKAVAILPYSVGQQGDNRVYGPAVLVVYPPHTTSAQAGAIATLLINKAVGSKLTRVLMHVADREKS